MPHATVTDAGVVVPWTARGPVAVSFDGRYVWSFAARRDGRRTTGGWRVPWPDVLQPRLSGTTRVRLERGGATLFDSAVAFGGRPEPLVLHDRHGHPLAVDKMGHFTRVFSETDDDVRRRVAESTRKALVDLREAGYDAHLSYGCLLGAVRDGRMIGHDSDADVAYLSPHGSPADVIRESFAMERALRRRGWKVVRMSGADLKLLHPLPDGRDVHIDVFAGFHVGDTFYLLGSRSGRLPRAALTPTGTVTLEGVELPAPARPEEVLEFLYGADWRAPDPSFRSVDPAQGVHRLDGWFRGFRTDAIAWNELYRGRRAEIPSAPSAFARWADELLPPGAGIAEIGCGNGRDVTWFFERGRPVRAFDFSGAAVRQTRRRLERAAGAIDDVGALALNDSRSALVAGAELARTPTPMSLYARGLVGCLDDEALDHLWLLASMSLRRGGVLLLEFPATGTAEPSVPARLHRRIDPSGIVAGIRRRGGLVEQVEVGPGQDFFDRHDPRVARVVARWTTQESR